MSDYPVIGTKQGSDFAYSKETRGYAGEEPGEPGKLEKRKSLPPSEEGAQGDQQRPGQVFASVSVHKHHDVQFGSNLGDWSGMGNQQSDV